MRYTISEIAKGDHVCTAKITLSDQGNTVVGEAHVDASVEEKEDICFVNLNIFYNPELRKILDKYPETKQELQEELIEVLYETIETEKDMIETVTDF
ncbi:hypothetical protein CathTA2_0828 [Caldalkalibacillus thermarum TA2.A1]|uniref:Uncharacterized protein n=1 Tax=Caldalkalibacillus thermarum (strain TA2.A1) TaxID=986075 RepID=F5L4W5_CALTT|nr:hypothetical protein [Caldalkalibacillus thermarum]EGL83617.1 hypothetical protein CathTA2_0828 [Caldalkalibacillus thermarum TA2.A1]QZT33699.1 hypothetical protein HUR95_15980 [Caldalkalibacillus thermarum TA2.A1]